MKLIHILFILSVSSCSIYSPTTQPPPSAFDVLEGCWVFQSRDGLIQQLRFKKVDFNLFEQEVLNKVPKLDGSFVENSFKGQLSVQDSGDFIFMDDSSMQSERGKYELKEGMLLQFDGDGDKRGEFSRCAVG